MPTTTNPKSRSTRTKLDKKKRDQIGPEVKVGREEIFPSNFYLFISMELCGTATNLYAVELFDAWSYFLSVSLIAGSLSVVWS